MDHRKKIVELRESTGMNGKEFCEYFQIPYRTVTIWERDNRHALEYVLRLLEYYIFKYITKITKELENLAIGHKILYTKLKYELFCISGGYIWKVRIL